MTGDHHRKWVAPQRLSDRAAASVGPTQTSSDPSVSARLARGNSAAAVPHAPLKRSSDSGGNRGESAIIAIQRALDCSENLARISINRALFRQRLAWKNPIKRELAAATHGNKSPHRSLQRSDFRGVIRHAHDGSAPRLCRKTRRIALVTFDA